VTVYSPQLLTPATAKRLVADRVRQARVAQNLKQSTLAERAGVALPTLRRFEQKGEVSLKYLVRILHALGRLDELDTLLRPLPAATMAELEMRSAQPTRKRGRR
jgi:transcriptional regulator with XRE-family HTH domain